jgi:TPR repeat protein
MGQMILEGLAPEKDMSIALKLFTEAASHNESRALNGLGYMQYHGI